MAWSTATVHPMAWPGRRGHFSLHLLAGPGAALAGEVEQARATFEQAIAYANDVGLFAEEVDPLSGELLGNFPQAFSHIGLVNAGMGNLASTVTMFKGTGGSEHVLEKGQDPCHARPGVVEAAPLV